MRTQRGDVAPDFSVVTVAGERLRLRELAGRRVWLSFFRYGSCPMCSFRIHELVRDWGRFTGHGFELVTIWPSPPAKLEELCERLQPAFHVVADPQLELFELYGLQTGLFSKQTLRRIVSGGSFTRAVAEMTMPRGPADILIDTEGFVERAFYGRERAEHISLDLVEDFMHGDPKTLLDDSLCSVDVG